MALLTASHLQALTLTTDQCPELSPATSLSSLESVPSSPTSSVYTPDTDDLETSFQHKSQIVTGLGLELSSLTRSALAYYANNSLATSSSQYSQHSSSLYASDSSCSEYGPHSPLQPYNSYCDTNYYASSSSLWSDPDSIYNAPKSCFSHESVPRSAYSLSESTQLDVIPLMKPSFAGSQYLLHTVDAQYAPSESEDEDDELSEQEALDLLNAATQLRTQKRRSQDEQLEEAFNRSRLRLPRRSSEELSAAFNAGFTELKRKPVNPHAILRKQFRASALEAEGLADDLSQLSVHDKVLAGADLPLRMFLGVSSVMNRLEHDRKAREVRSAMMQPSISFASFSR